MSQKCEQCSSAFSEARNLKKHMKIHSGEKPNKCKQCDFATLYASVLRTHSKRHNGGEKKGKQMQPV